MTSGRTVRGAENKKAHGIVPVIYLSLKGVYLFKNSGFRIRIDLMRIRIQIGIQHFLSLRIRTPDPDPGLDDLKLKQIYNQKFNFNFFNQKLQFTYPQASQDAQATGETFSPQKRTSSTSKDENSVLFSIFWGHFCPPGSGYAICMRIRIRQLKLMRIRIQIRIRIRNPEKIQVLIRFIMTFLSALMQNLAPLLPAESMGRGLCSYHNSYGNRQVQVYCTYFESGFICVAGFKSIKSNKKKAQKIKDNTVF